ncbi:MAG: cupin domain-containing protein [Proteobacteria bacterium]|nr:cupin domain-containing protein [Pseudomonadota bacterium]
MDRKTFEDELKRDGYDVATSTTPGAKVNPEHSHPFDVRAMVLKGAVTLTTGGTTTTYKPGEIFSMERGCQHFESYGPEGAVSLVGRKH